MDIYVVWYPLTSMMAAIIRGMDSFRELRYSGVICLHTLSAILFKPPIWTNKLRKAAISKQIKLQGPGWSRSLTNLKLFTKLP